MKKNKGVNKLGFVGILGFIGVIGIFTGRREMFSFFAFFVFFQYFKVMPDELFQDNLRKTCIVAFFLTLTSLAIFMALGMIYDTTSILKSGLGLTYCVAIASFTLVFSYFQYKEKKGLE